MKHTFILWRQPLPLSWLTVLEIASLVSWLTELHFCSGRKLWNDDIIELHRKLAWRLNIQIEEIQGLQMCTISVHNLTHIHLSIINFSSPDNYWCAVYERAVKQYVKESHNCKGIEATFAQSESRWEFLKPLQAAYKGRDGKIDLRMVSAFIYTILGWRGISGIQICLNLLEMHFRLVSIVIIMVSRETLYSIIVAMV